MLSLKANDDETQGHEMPSMSKAAKHGGANLALAKAMIGKRSSGAAGTHADRRTRRARTRAAQRARILKDW